MTKRVLTLLLGLSLIAAGGLLFVPASRAALLISLDKWWPLFLALAGVVRVSGFLLDRVPRSPVGGMMLAALGGILLAFNFSHGAASDYPLLALLAGYWFWLLLAFVAGRVLRQYAVGAESERGRRAPRAFSFGAVCVMLLLTAAGLAANYVERHPLPQVHAALEASNDD